MFGKILFTLLLFSVSLSEAYAQNISTKNLHSMMLCGDSTVWTVGWNGWAQLGDGTVNNSSTPLQVSGANDMLAVVAGYNHSMSLRSDGTVWAWGGNNDGQLGDGTTTARGGPVQVSGLTGAAFIGTGAYNSYAIKSDGTLWAWGDNLHGQLGDGTTTDRLIPVQISGITGVTAVVGGEYHTIALKSDGTVWTWGRNNRGQLGDGGTTSNSTPTQVSGLSNIVSIGAGRNHSLVLKSDGTVWSWGANGNGQLGDGTTTDKYTPVQVSGLASVIDISGGRDHSVALKSDGTLWAWGLNADGQLGDGTTTQSEAPIQSAPSFSDFSEASAGKNYTMTLRNNGEIWSWGDNSTGQLGDGTTTDRLNPVQMQLSCSPAISCDTPSVGFTYTDSFLTVSFIDTSSSADIINTWKWSFGDGDTSINQNPTHTYDTAGTYNVCLTVINSCGNSNVHCEDIIIKDDTTGVKDINSKAFIKIYPNPNKGIFEVLFPNTATQEIVIELYDVLGKHLYSENVTGSKKTVKIEEAYPKGIYFLKIYLGNDIIVKKIVYK